MRGEDLAGGHKGQIIGGGGRQSGRPGLDKCLSDLVQSRHAERIAPPERLDRIEGVDLTGADGLLADREIRHRLAVLPQAEACRREGVEEESVRADDSGEERDPREFRRRGFGEFDADLGLGRRRTRDPQTGAGEKGGRKVTEPESAAHMGILARRSWPSAADRALLFAYRATPSHPIRPILIACRQEAV